MSTTTTTTPETKAIIGNPNSSFWLYSSHTGFDLTDPPSPYSHPLTPRLTLHTTTTPITIHPPKSALVIIDMQNFFLSPLLGRPTASNGLKAQAQLLRYAIPAARKAGIRIIWLNWGLTQQDIDDMPPATLRAFGFQTVPAAEFEAYGEAREKQAAVDSHGVNEGADTFHERQKQMKDDLGWRSRLYKGLGSDVGAVTLPSGATIPGGDLLMRDQWNSALTPELDAAYRAGLNLSSSPPDVWLHKNRMSGLWGARTPCTEFLQKEGIKTLLFAGVNTDQCVGGSLQDAFTKGYDCVLLSDGCGTTSPAACQESVEFNCAKTWGFAMTCESLWDGVQAMVDS